jgi:alkylated DNA nucleotide flippase Atl1
VSDLTERIIRTVESIPAGRVMTYGDIAQATGTGARAVGRILHNGGHDIPWWRVVDEVGGASTTGSGATPAKRDREQTRAIREWANHNEYELSGRGRIPEYHRGIRQRPLNRRLTAPECVDSFAS